MKNKIRALDTDVLIIGSGGAGLRAAIEAHDLGVDVLVISKSGVGKAHTINAEGGINAALGSVDKEDNWKIHYEDTLKEGHYLSNKKMAGILAKEAIARILELNNWGLPFNKTKEGKIDQRYFGAHRYRRTCYSADKTGYELLKTLISQVKKRGIKHIGNLIVTSILTKNNSAYGVTCVNFGNGGFFVIQAKSIILATGGFTRIYEVSTHPEESYGDGLAMAYNVGAELQDMELIQFHPTGMAFPARYRGILATEALRGEGAKLFNAKGERFMSNYDSKRMELSARDVVARAIYTEIEEGRGTENGGVWLDITHVDPSTIKKKLPKMYKQFLELAKKDITKERIEVTPTAHYTMGGVKVNPMTTETKIKNLFAAGETSAGLHGANRLGGNSLAETQVFGRRAGLFAAKATKKAKSQAIDWKKVGDEYNRIILPLKRKGKRKLNEHLLKERLRETMWKYAGIKRDEKNLRIALKEINKVKKSLNKISVSGNLKKNHAWIDFLDITTMIVVCEAVIRSALMRRESRGAHWRGDYLEKDDNNWLANIICRKNLKGSMALGKTESEIMTFRIEKDSLGKMKIPADAYYGIQTARALKNFPISNLKFPFEFIKSYTLIKKAAALTNTKIGRLDRKISSAITKACDEILEHKFDDQFVLNPYQAEAGTSQNMNLNEVIANRAIEILGGKKGDYAIVNPNDHVNMSQSTNDTFPSATNIGAYEMIYRKLLPSLENLIKTLKIKSNEFSTIIKSGRTHMMDAVPLTLGQEFSGYYFTLEKKREGIEITAKDLTELSLGGTAIGTGLNAGPKYAKEVLLQINKLTGYKFKASKNLFASLQNLSPATRVSASLRNLAIELSKIANDLRLMGSGPTTGLDEIKLPAVQPGSSIMPGKVNPVIPGVMNQICFQVIGNDTTIVHAAQAGNLDLNVMTPVVAYNLFNSIEILSNGMEVFADKCIVGIKPNKKRIKEYLEMNPVAVTALTPYIGYNKAAEVVKKSYQQKRPIKEVVLEMKLMGKKRLERILDFKKMAKGGVVK